eukprot:TRINITY_DN23664_c0_g1_i1.p1 TRINITY_DN23664_c0_g1~~TRINITY_DN23664_c0_g1_i1.p1  ORF type:complete len:280 (-),score=56.22 TRINITY_DN23664_c0_g1_i1:177-1016(-)
MEGERQRWTRRVMLSYFVDWLLSLLSIVCVELVPHFFVEPHHRFRPADDPAFAYPNLESIVPTWMLFCGISLLPPLVFAIAQLRKRNLHDFHHACLSLAEALAVTFIATNLIKYSAGRYRPNWYDRQGTGVMEVKDARMSFPSGHSSLSFCAATVVSLYLLGSTRVLSKTRSGELWMLFLSLSPFVVSGFVAVSRTRDYHHHFSDILAGSVIGVCAGVSGYCLNYPNILGTRSGEPKVRSYDEGEEQAGGENEGTVGFEMEAMEEGLEGSPNHGGELKV